MHNCVLDFADMSLGYVHEVETLTDWVFKTRSVREFIILKLSTEQSSVT